jgi:DNA-binding MarR family transcriptional regulator
VRDLDGATKGKAVWAPPKAAFWATSEILPKNRRVADARPQESYAESYVQIIFRVEQLHRQFLEMIRLELDGLGIYDINNIQGLILFNIGDAEMTIGELTLRGCYLGSNVSYNVKKLVETGYLAQQRAVHDRRSFHVRLTEKGSNLRKSILAMHERHIEMLNQTAITDEDLSAATTTLRRLERFWVRVGAHGRSPPMLARSSS